MATNPMAIFDPAATPAHVKAAQEAGTSNIVTRSQVNALTFPGKVWTVTIDGSKRPLMRTNQDGEEELVQTFDAIIIAYNENRGRAYFGGRAYDPGQESAPVCWSNDGITSSPNATERQSEKCNVCPQAIKGSRQTDQGKAATACAVHRNLAVIPKSKDLSTAPLLRLKIPQTSDFDGLNKEAQAKGMFAFSNYLNFLKSKSVPFTYSLTTKIKFDNTKSYPKLWFSPGRWLTEEEAATCAEIAEQPTLDDLLKTDFTGFGNAGARPPGITEADEQETDDDEEVIIPPPAGPRPTATAAAPKAAAPARPEPAPPAPVPGPASTSTKAKTAAQKKTEAAAAAAAARKAAVLDDDEEVGGEPTPRLSIDTDPSYGDPREKKPTSGRGAAPVTATASSDLDTILTGWDDD
jgi:hypothetical protein